VQRWQERFGEILSAPAEEREHDLNTTQHPIGINENPSKHAEIFNLSTPNVNYSGRTAPLTSKVSFYIFIQQI